MGEGVDNGAAAQPAKSELAEQKEWESLFKAPDHIEPGADLYRQAKEAGRSHPIAGALLPRFDEVDTTKASPETTAVLSPEEIQTASHRTIPKSLSIGFNGPSSVPDIERGSMIVLSDKAAEHRITPEAQVMDKLTASQGLKDQEAIRALSHDVVREGDPVGMSRADLNLLNKYVHVPEGLKILADHAKHIGDKHFAIKSDIKAIHIGVDDLDPGLPQTSIKFEETITAENVKTLAENGSFIKKAAMQVVKAGEYMKELTGKTSWTKSEILDVLKEIPTLPDPERYKH